MIAYDCAENDRIETVGGRQVVTPASPR
jgi:hypothetical protein